MSEERRRQFVFDLSKAGRQNKNGWTKWVIPFVNTNWPREQKFRTSFLSREWVNLLEHTENDFPEVYAAVKKFLVPFKPDDFSYSFFGFTKTTDSTKSFAGRFPKTVLDFLDQVIPADLIYKPYQLPEILELIVETDPSLGSDPRYLRLMDQIEHTT